MEAFRTNNNPTVVRAFPVLRVSIVHSVSKKKKKKKKNLHLGQFGHEVEEPLSHLEMYWSQQLAEEDRCL